MEEERDEVALKRSMQQFQDLETLHKVQFEALLKFHQNQETQLLARQGEGPNQELTMHQCAGQFEALQHFQRDQYSQHQQKQKMQFDFLMNQKFDAGL